MTLLNIGLRRTDPCPGWDQASGSDWGVAQERFGAIGNSPGVGVSAIFSASVRRRFPHQAPLSPALAPAPASVRKVPASQSPISARTSAHRQPTQSICRQCSTEVTTAD